MEYLNHTFPDENLTNSKHLVEKYPSSCPLEGHEA